MIYIKKLFLFLCLFFLFNTLEVNSNSDKELIYNKSELYEENDYYLYFNNVNSKKLKSILDILDIEVLSYTIDNEKYYVNNIDELLSKYLINKSLEEELYYTEYGIMIDGMHIKCVNNELIKLENFVNIY